MKKTLLVCCTAIILGILLTFTTVRAQDSDAVFEGDSKSFVDITDSNYLFGNFNSLYPGCDVTKNISVHNPDSRSVRIYIHANAVSDKYSSLLGQISLLVLDEDGNTLNTSADISQKIMICELDSGQSRNLQLRLHINRKTDGTLKSTEGKIDWIFSTEEYATPESFSTVNAPKTGGNYNSLIFALSGIALASLVIIIFSAIRRKKSTNF